MSIPTPPQGLSLPLTYNANDYAIDAIYADGGGQVFAQIRNGAAVQLFPAGGGGALQIVTFGVGVSNVVVPAGVLNMWFTASGAGGGGGGGVSTAGFLAGSGGASGEAVNFSNIAVIPGETLTITGGTPGAGGAPALPGGAGGTTTVVGSSSGLLLSLAGGGGGGVSLAAGVPGGAGSPGGLLGSTAGQWPTTILGGVSLGGPGGSNVAGGVGGTCDQLSGTGIGFFGGGGAGGAKVNGAAQIAGGAGGIGFVRIILFG